MRRRSPTDMARPLWLDTLEPGDDPTDRATWRPPLPGDTTADVAVVGAGFTGLWTAYHLARLDPGLRVVVVEGAFAGFGASGRNGGWCSALLPVSWERLAAIGGRDGAVRLQRAMHAVVDDIGAIAHEEGIDAQFAKGGYLHLATNPRQVERLHAELREARSWGFGEEDLRWLDRHEAADAVRADGVLGATFTPHCAALHPARLARGLARAVERHGVTVHEGTRVLGLEPGLVDTDHGRIRARIVVRATEAYTARISGHRRELAPLYSLMVATEPLPDDVWDRIGLAGRPTFNDARHLIVYGQRTADGRLAFGGRGAPYHWASGISADHERDTSVHDALRAALVAMFPVLDGVAFSHAWGGPLGAPRDWTPSVGLDRDTGFAWAGGYVGDGVAASALAGRTLAELVTGTASGLTGLPWVGHRSRRWEPEPFRWLGINGALRLPAHLDAAEEAGRRAPRLRSRLLGALVGH